MDPHLKNLVGCFSRYVQIAVAFGAPWPRGYGPHRPRCAPDCEGCTPPQRVLAHWWPLGKRLAVEALDIESSNTWQQACPDPQDPEAAVSNLIEAKIAARPAHFRDMADLEDVTGAVLDDAWAWLEAMLGDAT